MFYNIVSVLRFLHLESTQDPPALLAMLCSALSAALFPSVRLLPFFGLPVRLWSAD
jgi:hypothetical protein